MNISGDLAPFFFIKHKDLSQTPLVTKAREKLANLNCVPENEWIANYTLGEIESNEKLVDSKGNLKPQVFKLYNLNYATTFKGSKRNIGYSEFLLNASEAKKAIGVSTNDSWVFSMLIELYRNARKSGTSYLIGKNKFDLFNITDEEAKEINFYYIRALQDFVVAGVKHNDNASQGFDMLYLNNMHKPENMNDLKTLFVNEFQMSNVLCAKILSVVSWAAASGCLDASNIFLRLYNKGVDLPTNKEKIANYLMWEKLVQQNTFFGALIEPIYNIKQQVLNQTLMFQQEFDIKQKEAQQQYAALGF